MRTKALTLIVTLVNLLLVQGLGLESPHKNKATDLNRRIINGDEVSQADYLFMVQLQNGESQCGGSIIDNNFILTAAHCIFGLDCIATQITTPQLAEETKPKTVSACYLHPNFVDTKYFYDIALIQTDDDMLQDGKLKAVPLPAPGTQYAQGSPGVTIGWGKREDNKNSLPLLKGDVLVEDWDTCNNKFRTANRSCELDPNACNVDQDIPKRGFCTQGQGEKPPTSCFGDFGGPVVIDNEIAGVIITSLLINGKCEMGTPTLTTNVVDYLPWIYSFIDPDKDTSSFPVAEESA